MYESFFNFTVKPFAMSPDPAFMYASKQHAEALTMLEYAIESQAPFSLLTGEIGSGKTTILRHFLRSLGEQLTVGLISNTHAGFRSVHPWAMSAFGIAAADHSDIAQYEALIAFVVSEYGKGKRTLLIFDEAQNLSVRSLEELRLLSNVNSEQDLALQMILIGQPELREKLSRPELTQFAQRISVDFHLNALSRVEAWSYVRHRLEVAGGDPTLFRPGAIAFIHELTLGIPRLINQICDLSLVYAFAEKSRSISAALIEQVIADRNRGHTIQVFAPKPDFAAAPPVAASLPLVRPPGRPAEAV
jgi:general secretion pathway protein A